MFDELVSYFICLGGFNTTNCASTYFKHAFDIKEDISTSISWLGKSSSKKQALNKTKFADACKEAMKHNLSLKKQCLSKFVDGITKALKSLKERRRRRSHNPVEEEDNYEPNIYQQRKRQSNNDTEPDEELQKLKDEEQDYNDKLYEESQQPQQQNDGNVMNEEQQWKNHSQQSLEQQESTTDADTLLDDSTNSDDHQFDYAEVDKHNIL